MKVTIIVFLLIFFDVGLNAQGVIYNQEFQVNTSTTGWQWYPDVCGLPDNGFVICWASPDDDCLGVYGQLYENNGLRDGSEFQVNTYTTHCQERTSVCSLQNGGFVVCWQSYGQDGNGSGIYGQIYDSTGAKRGSEFQINTYTKDIQRNPKVSSLIDGGFVICWESYGQDGNHYGIYAQLYDSIGVRRGKEFRVNTTTDDIQSFPCVSGLQDGGFVICWQSWYYRHYHQGIFGQLFNNNGTQRGNEFQIKSINGSEQGEPSVSGLRGGGFIICYDSWTGGSIFRVFGQIFSNYGEQRESEFQVNTFIDDDTWGPRISTLSDGGFVVCWNSDSQDGSYNGIYAQLFDSNGIQKGSEFRVNDYIHNQQHRPCISSVSNGRFVVCWISDGQDGDGYGIFGKYYLESPLIHTLKPFSLLQPTDDAFLKSIIYTFKWSQPSDIHINFPWEVEYHLYLDENADFSSPRIITAIYDTTCIVDSLVPGQNYYWKVLAKNIEDDSLWSSETFVFLMSPDATGLETENNPLTSGFALFGNYPNPFNAETMISYELPSSSAAVSIKIYNVAGQVVRVFNNPPQMAGVNKLKWDGQDNNGLALPSGIYFCALEVNGQFRTSQKMILMK